MNKRIKKPTVKPEQRQDWLERSERRESASHIAATDGFDVRTVRKHIELAKHEREVVQARAAVLRNALEQHYADLHGFAERLLSRIEEREGAQFSENDGYLQTALKQHVPRSPIWTNLNRHDGMLAEITKIKDEIKNKLEHEVGADTRLKSNLSPDEDGVIPGIKGALVFQADRWSKGYKGLNIDGSLIVEPTEEDGFVRLRYGFSQMGLVRKENVPIIREVLKDFESRIKKWNEFVDLEKAFTEDKRIKQNLKDELVVIILKRIVPGRCKFCPI